LYNRKVFDIINREEKEFNERKLWRLNHQIETYTKPAVPRRTSFILSFSILKKSSCTIKTSFGDEVFGEMKSSLFN